MSYRLLEVFKIGNNFKSSWAICPYSYLIYLILLAIIELILLTIVPNNR